MPDSQDSLVAAILGRYRQLCADHETSQQNVERMQAHQQQLAAQINDCFAAARLFGFDLVAEFQREASGDPSQLPLQALVPTTLAPVPALASPRGGPKIKDLILEVVEKVYPQSIGALDVGRDLANQGHAIHKKTPEMNLHRWLKKGCVERDGTKWRFVPSDRRTSPINGAINGTRSTADIAHARTH